MIRNVRPRNFLIAALVTLTVVVSLLFVSASLRHRLVLRAYFTNGMGLRSGATVRMAGIDVGSVRSVRLRPELKSGPVEVVLVLNPHYELKIPNDSTAMLETAGLLGETCVEIDTSTASGPPIAVNGVLKTRPSETPTAAKVMEQLADTLSKDVKTLSNRLENCGGKKDAGCDKTRQSARPNDPVH